MQQKTIDRGLYRIWLGIACIVIGVCMNLAAMTFYYMGVQDEVYPGLATGTGEILFTGGTLLGLGVYKHVKTRPNDHTRPKTGP